EDGIRDLTVTGVQTCALPISCTAGQSRNHTLGLALGQGMSLDAALGGRRSVIEGVATAAAVARLAARLDVEMPIAAAVEGVLHRSEERRVGKGARPGGGRRRE